MQAEGVRVDNSFLFVIVGEGAVKLQPMPLPQGMTPSSTEIIVSLNEHLVQVLQVSEEY